MKWLNKIAQAISRGTVFDRKTSILTQTRLPSSMTYTDFMSKRAKEFGKAKMFLTAMNLINPPDMVMGYIPIYNVQYFEVATSQDILKFRAIGAEFLAKQAGGSKAFRIDIILQGINTFIYLRLFQLLYLYGMKYTEVDPAMLKSLQNTDTGRLDDVLNFFTQKTGENVELVKKNTDEVQNVYWEMNPVGVDGSPAQYVDKFSTDWYIHDQHQTFNLITKNEIHFDLYVESYIYYRDIENKDITKVSLLLRKHVPPKMIKAVRPVNVLHEGYGINDMYNDKYIGKASSDSPTYVGPEQRKIAAQYLAYNKQLTNMTPLEARYFMNNVPYTNPKDIGIQGSMKGLKNASTLDQEFFDVSSSQTKENIREFYGRTGTISDGVKEKLPLEGPDKIDETIMQKFNSKVNDVLKQGDNRTKKGMVQGAIKISNTFMKTTTDRSVLTSVIDKGTDVKNALYAIKGASLGEDIRYAVTYTSTYPANYEFIDIFYSQMQSMFPNALQYGGVSIETMSDVNIRDMGILSYVYRARDAIVIGMNKAKDDAITFLLPDFVKDKMTSYNVVYELFGNRTIDISLSNFTLHSVNTIETIDGKETRPISDNPIGFRRNAQQYIAKKNINPSKLMYIRPYQYYYYDFPHQIMKKLPWYIDPTFKPIDILVTIRDINTCIFYIAENQDGELVLYTYIGTRAASIGGEL